MHGADVVHHLGQVEELGRSSRDEHGQGHSVPVGGQIGRGLGGVEEVGGSVVSVLLVQLLDLLRTVVVGRDPHQVDSHHAEAQASVVGHVLQRGLLDVVVAGTNVFRVACVQPRVLLPFHGSHLQVDGQPMHGGGVPSNYLKLLLPFFCDTTGLLQKMSRQIERSIPCLDPTALLYSCLRADRVGPFARDVVDLRGRRPFELEHAKDPGGGGRQRPPPGPACRCQDPGKNSLAESRLIASDLSPQLRSTARHQPSNRLHLG